MGEWNAQWDIWKVGHFATLQTENMEGTTQETFKKIQKLQRELKVGWQNQSSSSHSSCHFSNHWHQYLEPTLEHSAI